MDINGCGFDGEGSGSGQGKKRETHGKDEKAEKITHEGEPLADERTEGFRLMSGRSYRGVSTRSLMAGRLEEWGKNDLNRPFAPEIDAIAMAPGCMRAARCSCLMSNSKIFLFSRLSAPLEPVREPPPTPPLYFCS